MLYLYKKCFFFIERRGMEERKEMVNEIQSDSWNRGKRQSGKKGKNSMTDCIFQLMGTLLFLTMYLDTFTIEGWSLCSLFSIMQKLATTLEGVLCDFWNFTRGFSFCLVFLWCSLLEPAPMMWGRPSSSKEVLLTAPSEVFTDSHSNHQTWRAVSVWMSWVLAMESPQLRSWCGEEVSLTYPSRIPDWSTESASTVIAVLYHLVSFHAAMVAQQLTWRKRSGNNES